MLVVDDRLALIDEVELALNEFVQETDAEIDCVCENE